VARYATLDARPDEAEAAIVVEDAYQGRGLGTLLVERLLSYARMHGIRYFVAEINSENDRVLRFIRRSGLPAEKKLEAGVWLIRVRLA
jgi:GNAT superfamily N-acetyltransferase